MRSARPPSLAALTIVAAALLCSCPSGGTAPVVPPSSDAALRALTLDSATIALSGQSLAAAVREDAASAALAIVLPAGATATIDGKAGTDLVLANLVPGENKVTIEVTAEDGGTRLSYVLTITRPHPLAVALDSPAEGATVNSSHPAFAWKASRGAAGYLLRIEANTTLTAAAREQSSEAPAIDQLIWTLKASTSYAWQVKSLDAAGKEIEGGASAIRTFTTADLPAAPLNVTAAVTDGLHPVIAWQAVEGALSYRVYRGTSTTAAWSGTATTWTDAGAPPGVETSYTVKSVNSFGLSQSSAAANATTAANGGSAVITIE